MQDRYIDGNVPLTTVETQRGTAVAQVSAGKGREALQISAGTSHSAVMLARGEEVLAFGHGRNMRLGHGNCDNQFLPRAISSLLGIRVVEVLASRARAVVLTAAGGIPRNGLHGRLGRRW